MQSKVEVDHDADTVARRPHTKFLVYLNCTPVYWFYIKQTSVESNIFGLEFITIKVCCKYLRGL